MNDKIELRPGAFARNGSLFFRCLDGSTISCNCIADSYAEKIAEIYNAGATPYPGILIEALESCMKVLAEFEIKPHHANKPLVADELRGFALGALSKAQAALKSYKEGE